MVDEIKDHVSRHKVAYLVGSYILIAGITYAITRGTIAQRGMGVGIAQRGILNTASQFFIVNVVGQEYGGKACLNMETGKIFISQKKAAIEFSLNEGVLSGHLNGKFPDANGLHFERVNLVPQN